MRSPSAKADPSEKVLSGNDIAGMACTADIRRSASSWPGISMDRERVSRSDEFGYIYRYGVSEAVNDNESGARLYEYTLILWTSDCQTWQISTLPTLQIQLPGRALKD